jgi:hypothetical protein
MHARSRKQPTVGTMLIIDDKILIIHMRKCGGTSFCSGLIKLLPPSRAEYYGYTAEGEARSTESFQNGGLWKHSTALDVLKRTPPDKFRKYRKLFVSVRPHYERVASYYFHMRRHNQRDPERYPAVRNLSFSDYLRSPYVIKESVVDFCTDEKGHQIVDELVEFKFLDKRYTKLANALGFPAQQIAKMNSNPDELDYNGLYTKENKKFIDKKFAKEIDFLKRVRAARKKA